ncbi:MAG: 4Fe-4S binding protein [Actinomycetota bacterium]|nr:4Fe-4S binding protein [Actinomycetota bacterium]
MSTTAERLVVRAGCTACGACLLTCPVRALLPAPLRPVVVDRRCTACGECVEICPRGVLLILSPEAA